MKLFIFFSLLGISYATISTIVDIEYDDIITNGGTVTLGCEYELLPTEGQPPIIFWIKGVSVDNPDAEVIFKGYRYWNESLGEYREFFGGYEGRASVPDLQSPAITLTGVTKTDEGRYWCMVAEWSGRQQSGTNADSVALMVGSAKNFVSVHTQSNATVAEGDAIELECIGMGKGSHDLVTWYLGPFHNSDENNFTHSEIGIYKTIGWFDLTASTSNVNAEFPNMAISNTRSLTISNTAINNVGRYWCELSSQKPLNKELETARSSVELAVTSSVEVICDGDSSGMLPNPNDCSSYYQCTNDGPILRPCPYEGMAFNPVKQICDWASNVPPPCGTNVEG